MNVGSDHERLHIKLLDRQNASHNVYTIASISISC